MAGARAFVVAAPGVDAERFFAEVDARGDDVPSPAELIEMAARHALTVLPPKAA